jgi:ABC-type multidrug transport system fused ATPase/permease subunit
MRLRDPALPVSGISGVGDAPTSDLRSPEDNLRLWQFLSVSWMFPMIRIGKTKTLNEEDVWFLAYEFQHRRLYEKFSTLSGTVVRRLLKANGLDICILTLSSSTETVCQCIAPVVLQQLLAAMERPNAPKRVALTYALIILALRLVTAQAEVFNTWFGRRCYERSRGEMILMVYEKALLRKNVIGVDPELKLKTAEVANGVGVANEISSKANPSLASRILASLDVRRLFSKSRKQHVVRSEVKAPASMGKILNLCRGDVYEVAQRFWEIENIVETGLGLVLSITFIWKLLGPSCFIGVLVIIVGQVLNAFLTKIQLGIIKRLRGATDERLQVTSQYIESIRHLRWYSWHEKWLKQIHEARDHELFLRVQTMIWSSIMNFTNMLTNGLFPVAALYGYTVLAKQTLSIDIIFPALSLFNMLASNLRDIPEIITQLANAYIAMSRIEDFMKEPDREEDTNQVSTPDGSIHLDNCDFAWPDQKQAVLHGLNLKFDEGFHVVYGKVGAGKTALLQGLMGELDKLGGTSQLPNETMGYCSQTPWLQSMTIRDNILFSAPLDEWRYRDVLDACELLPDLANFEHGDLSPIGENGIGLSGGQKARVALARAVYSQARILLLDDSISALDFNTAENIVSKCFDGPLMRGRIVILVTHRTDLVRKLATQFVEIEDGRASVSSNESSIADTAENGNSNGNKADANGMIERTKKIDGDAAPKKFEEEEHRAEFGVKTRVYWQYIKSGKLRWWAFSTLALAVWRLSAVGQTWFLKSWGEAYQQISRTYLPFGMFLDYQTVYRHSFGISTAAPFKDPFIDFPPPEDNVKPWLLWYLAIACWIAFAAWLAQIFLVVLMYSSAKTLFSQAITRVSKANFRFYDVTPVGRLMNRLTSDIGTIDGGIAQQFHVIAYQSINWVAALVVIASVTPTFLIFSVCFVAFTIWIFSMFLPTSQSLRRLEMTSLSPLFANFGELLHGLTTVRAFHAQHRFLDRIIGVVDKFQGMDHFYWTLQNWLAFRLQNVSAIAAFILTALALYTNVSPGLTAFVLTAAGSFVRSTHVLCRRFGSLQMDFVSVERVDELMRLEVEPSGDMEPPAAWPVFGADVVLDNVTIRYAPHLEPALNNISIRIPGGSTTAILGRTGSGKSTLAIALLNVVRPDTGSITIDKLDIKTLQNQALRERVTFVAQDPVLFPGSIRHNLDPMEYHTDEECHNVLQRVCGRHGWTLEFNVEAGGRNLSQGQRQLIGLTRAILRRSSIVILDEATASVDYESSMEIQQILREELKEATVITIAHRLQAVKDADYAVILDKGRVTRQGPAKEMLKQDGDSLEHAME